MVICYTEKVLKDRINYLQGLIRVYNALPETVRGRLTSSKDKAEKMLADTRDELNDWETLNETDRIAHGGAAK